MEILPDNSREPMILSRLFSALLFAVQLANGADPFLAKPYLQLGRMPADPTHLELLWHTADVDADWKVEYRIANSSSWQSTTEPTYRKIEVPTIDAHRVYKIEFTNLMPGKAFEYRVTQDGQVLFSSASTARKSADQPYRMGIFGDIAADKLPQRAVAFQMAKAKPDMVLVTGDIVYSRGRISEYRHHYFDCYNADNASPEEGAPLTRSTLVVGVPGNHDIATTDFEKYPDSLAYFYYWSQPLNGPLLFPGGPHTGKLTGPPANLQAMRNAAGEQYPRMANFSFEYGNAHWTMLDSNTYVDWADADLRDWLKNDLMAAKDATWRFVGFHHPGFNSSSAHFDERQMRKVADLFEEFKVDVVFSGHVHNYQRSFPLKYEGKEKSWTWTLDRKFNGKTNTRPNGVIYVITGAGGAGVYNTEQNDKPDTWQKFTDKFMSKVNSFTQVDVNGKRFELRQISSTGVELDRMVITK